VFAVDYRGISVPEAAELRTSAGRVGRHVPHRQETGSRSWAAQKAGAAELEELLEGPTALTFVKGDAVTAAKAISTFSRQHDVPRVPGRLDGR